MTTNSISSASPIMSASVMQNLSRPPATPSAATGGGTQVLNNPHVNGADSIRTGLQIIPSPNDSAAALQSSALQIARLQSNPEQPTARAASAAYMTQAAARTQITPQQQTIGSLSVNVAA
jgi:hypothetical protein